MYIKVLHKLRPAVGVYLITLATICISPFLVMKSITKAV